MADKFQIILNSIDPQLQVFPPEQRSVTKDNVELALREGMRGRLLCAVDSMSGVFRAIVPRPPVRQLTDGELIEFKRIAKTKPWNAGKNDKGHVVDFRNPVRWVCDEYAPFIPGLTTAHIRAVNTRLYNAFMQHVIRHGLPEGVDIPTEQENKLRERWSAPSELGSRSCAGNSPISLKRGT